MKKQWQLVAGVILVFLIVLFAVANTNQVMINFFISKVKAPLILVILGSAIIGILITLSATTTTIWSQKKKIKELDKTITDYQENATKKIQEKQEQLERDFENQLSSIRATYEAQLVDKNRQIDKLTNPQPNVKTNQASPEQMNYFD
ncbi:putative membrane protein [Enterococcus sp. PF1-24]|uniref:LapA family protein n=1 Tax=unclassified Enterococcus TaxID=2608891 RepID=UPI0024757BB1|nr:MULTISPECIES: lipopolysaccharide assembly protein LapA domain-containing protein [unclassified Enterococcus]MDH6365465.1 putative membrane protein [Enterococcus sp. PFB1-1]MDH6402581.1 putative membrane protein [Enterococcus sp. PF1-24]